MATIQKQIAEITSKLEAWKIQIDTGARDKADPENGVSYGDGGALWLVDLICPFYTPENKIADQMLVDLIQRPFKDKRFKFHHTDLVTGERKVMELGG